MDVSRTPVREALRALESEGFVEIRPHHGAYVSTVTQEDVQEIYEVRGLIEPETVRQVTPVIPNAVLDQLEESLENVREQSDLVESVNAFHKVRVESVENELLKEVSYVVNGHAVRVRRFSQIHLRLLDEKSHREYLAIVRAMRERDAARAAQLMALHLEKSGQRMTELSSAFEV
jgi:DNA-binding GntR family transcriptional regulator